MQDLSDLTILIEKAAAIEGSYAALARKLGVTPQAVTNWKNGHSACQPEEQALMAEIAGLDPVAELARATVAKHAGTAKGSALLRALGKSLPVIGAALGSAGASAAAVLTTAGPELARWAMGLLHTMYIM